MSENIVAVYGTLKRGKTNHFIMELLSAEFLGVGKTAEKYYVQYIFPKTLIPCVCLPSTSAANASYSLQPLTEAWKVIL